MTTIRALGTGLAIGACWIAACSTGGSDPGEGVAGGASVAALAEGSPSAVGSVGMHLNIPNSVFTIDSLDWTIANASSSYTGVVDTTDDAGNAAQSIEFVAGGIASGSGYVVTLYGADSNGDPCTGSATGVTVSAGATSTAMVQVDCTVATDAAQVQLVESGSVYVEAGVTLVDQPAFGCPAITGVSISPAELYPPETAALGMASTSGSGGTPTIQWAATCGNGVPTIARPNAASATFSCGTAVGTSCTVTLTVGLDGTGVDGGSVGPVCAGVANTSIAETIACEAQCTTAASCPASTTACATPVCNAPGRCGSSFAPAGTSCSDSGGNVCNGVGACVPSFDVVRVGNGSVALASTMTAPVFIDQYGLGGAVVRSIPLASTGAQSLTLIGDISEGDLTTSADGRLLVLAGHNYPAGTTVSASTASSCIAGFVGSGVTPAVTMLSLPNAFSTGGAVRSAASVDGSEVWVVGTGAGTSAGLWYGPTDIQLFQTGAKLGRVLRIAGSPSQLYGDSNSNPPGLFTVGSGTPTTATPAITELPGLSTTFDASPFGFVFLNVGGIPTLYMADDSAGGTGGLGKWTFSGGTWSLVWRTMGVGTATDGGTTAAGYRGLAGYVTGSTVTLMASTGMPALLQDSLVVIVDTGLATGPASQTVAASSRANTNFRGVAVPPHP